MDTKQVDTEPAIIDWDHCVKLAGGKEELAREMMTLFIKHLPDSHTKINNAVQDKNLQELKNELHKLLGSCSYCGVPRLKVITAEFDQSARHTEETDSFDDLLEKFNTEVNSVMDAAKNFGD